MSQQYGGLPPLTPPSSPQQPSLPPAGLSWSDTWIKALTQPSEDTYQQIVSDTPLDGNSKAYTWIFIASIIAAAIGLVASFAFTRNVNFPGPDSATFRQFQSSALLINVICVPVVGLLSILGFAISVGITQFIAGLLGGTGDYSKLLYTTAAYAAPLRIIQAIIGAIPIVNCLNIIVAIYALVLDVIAVKVVNNFSWGRAIVASLLIPIIFVVLIGGLVVIVFLAILGPAIGNIFSNIVVGL